MTSPAHRPPPALVRSRSRLLQLGAALAAIAAACLTLTVGSSAPAGASAVTRHASGALSLRVSGNQLIDASGNPIRLIGVDHSGSEYACVDGEGFFSPSDSDTPSMIAAMKSWDINTVRVPLNEDCWLGINMPYPQYGGAAYQSAIVHYVNDLNAAGLYVILDLHWSAPGSETATGQAVAPDEGHAPAFWSSVATTFKGDPGVVFDLFNEPQNVTFGCLVNGGCTDAGFQVAGYNQLIGDVRDAGATNVIMVAGTAYATDPLGFESVMPDDPLGQLAISVHVYNFNSDNSPSVWDQWLLLMQRVPFVTGELGENDCTSDFIDTFMTWADAHDMSYLAWAFNTGACDAPSLITDSNGDPTPYGAGYKAHLAALAALGVPGTPGQVGSGQSGSGPSAPTVAATGITTLLPTPSGDGYVEISRTGAVVPFGDAIDFGSMAGIPLNQPVVGAAATPDGGGYWMVASDGGIFSFGDAGFYGSMGGKPLNQPIVGIAADPNGGGYWMVASDGGIFSFGDAAFYGSMGGKPLNRPIVGMAATPNGGGYWMVASDGGIFSFGDAAFYGSMGGKPLNQPIVGMAATPNGGGYWMVASDGGIFSFGDAAFYGSMGGKPLNQPIVGMAANPNGGGYWLVASDGGIFSFGDAPYEGSVPGL